MEKRRWGLLSSTHSHGECSFKFPTSLQSVLEQLLLMSPSYRSMHQHLDTMSMRTKPWNSDNIQVPWSICFRWRLKTGGSLKDCTSHCNSDKAEANLERKDNNVFLGSKIILMRSLVIFIFMYELEKRTQAFKIRCYQRLLDISKRGPCHQWGSLQKDRSRHWKHDELLTLVKKTETKVIWPHLNVF